MTRRLEIEPSVVDSYPRKPFLIAHRLADHPLLFLPKLIELATTLPSSCVEYNAGSLPINADPAKTPRTGLSVEETIRRIEECGSWMALKYVSRVPAYASLLNDCLAEVRDALGGATDGMFQKEGFIFVSSPSSITPYHMDREHNFLLQIHGTKQINLFDPRDRSLVSDAEMEEQLHGRDHRNMVYKEEYQRKATVFQISPGMGLHFPVTAPHWVQNGPAVSISFSITFRSAASERNAILYYINRRLRKSGLTPSTPGLHPWRDAVKLAAFRAAKKIPASVQPAHR